MAILDQVVSFLVSAQGSASIIAVVLEFIFRMFPSEKPLSILHVVGAIIQKVGSICIAAGGLLDKVLPQKLAAPKV